MEEIKRRQGQRLTEARKAAGFVSAREAALANGWSESTYRAHETGRRTIGQDDAERYARRFRARGVAVSARAILFGDDDDAEGAMALPDGIGRADIIPLMGKVDAGGDILREDQQVPPEGLDQIEIDDLAPSRPMIAFEVDGTSMLPEFEPGEIILCYSEQRRDTQTFLGEKAVVEIRDGHRYLKRIARGRRKHLHNLESWNARTIEDAEIVWVGEIVATIKAGRYRRRPRQ